MPGNLSISEPMPPSTAAVKGNRNLPGTADPAVDELLTAVSKASDRPALVAAIRALDRVLRARRDWIPNWHAANHRAAYWDIYGFREPKPDYGFPVEALIWPGPFAGDHLEQIRRMLDAKASRCGDGFGLDNP